MGSGEQRKLLLATLCPLCHSNLRLGAAVGIAASRADGSASERTQVDDQRLPIRYRQQVEIADDLIGEVRVPKALKYLAFSFLLGGVLTGQTALPGALAISGSEAPMELQSGAQPEKNISIDLNGLTVPVRIIIGPDGKVLHVHVISATPAQRRAIEEALMHWEYRPLELMGRPNEVETGLAFEFKSRRP
jgi:hypothetical protein